MSTLARPPVVGIGVDERSGQHMRATRVTRVRRHGEGPGGRNLRDGRKPSGGGSRTRVDRPRPGESQSLSSSCCSDLRTEPKKEYREECGSEGTRGRARDISSENSFSQSSNNILTKRRSASLHRSETRPRKPSTSREGIDDLISALYPVKSSSFYSAPNPTGMSPKEDSRVRRNVSRSKSPAVIYVDNALNGLNGPVKHEVSINLIREQKGVGTDENANGPRESWTRSSPRTRQTQVRKQQDDESSQQRSGLGGPRTPDEKELLQKRTQRDEDLRRLKAEIKLPSQNGRRRSHGESTRLVTRIVGRRNSDLGSNARYSPGETRSSASWRRSKRVSFSSESDLTLGEVTEEVSEEFNGQSDISMSLPSSLNTPESPDDWHKYLDNSPRESGGLPFDMMVDVPAMKPTLPFKSSDKCRSIVTRAKSLSNFPPPPPLHKNNHRKSGKGPRTLYPPPPPPRPPGRLPDSGLRRKSSSSR